MCMTEPPCWTADELRTRLHDYEKELRAAGKARNTVTTYVQHPERFINWLVGRYAPRLANGPAGPNHMTSKYQPLRDYLSKRPEPVVRLSFSEIEQLLGAELPAS